ncbi:hypothetical protein ACSBR1_039791 [Camellia fascicularis]
MGAPKIVPYMYRVLTGCGYAYRYGCTHTGYGKRSPVRLVQSGTAWVRHGYAFGVFWQHSSKRRQQQRGDGDPSIPFEGLRRRRRKEFRSASIWFCPLLHLFVFPPVRNWAEFLGAPAYQQTASNWLDPLTIIIKNKKNKKISAYRSRIRIILFWGFAVSVYPHSYPYRTRTRTRAS